MSALPAAGRRGRWRGGAADRLLPLRAAEAATRARRPARRGAATGARRASACEPAELIDPTALGSLPSDAEQDAAGRQEQHERRVAYLEWREHAARRLARKAGPLGRLTHRREDFFPQIDRERSGSAAAARRSSTRPTARAATATRTGPPATTATTPTRIEPYRRGRLRPAGKRGAPMNPREARRPASRVPQRPDGGDPRQPAPERRSLGASRGTYARSAGVCPTPTTRRSPSGSSPTGAAAARSYSPTRPQERRRRMPEQAEQTQRAVAYVRESTEEQGRGYSPDGQRQAIARYAADHGMQLVEEYLDFETGRAVGEAPGVSAPDRGRDGAPLRGRARLPHLTVRAQHGGGQALQEAPALRARDRRDLRHPAARRRRR